MKNESVKCNHCIYNYIIEFFENSEMHHSLTLIIMAIVQKILTLSKISNISLLLKEAKANSADPDQTAPSGAV